MVRTDTGSSDHQVLEVVYLITHQDKSRLDRVEGLRQGYYGREFCVRIGGVERRAYAYLADPKYIDDSLKPLRLVSRPGAGWSPLPSFP